MQARQLAELSKFRDQSYLVMLLQVQLFLETFESVCADCAGARHQLLNKR